MAVKLTIVGNGKFSTGDQSEVVISYDLSEGSTPIAPVNTSGEIPTMGITGQANFVETLDGTHPTSKLMLNNTIEFTDSLRGVFNGKVVSSSINNNVVSISAQSRFEKLNSVKNASDFVGTLAGAFEYYFELGSLIESDYEIDTSLEEIDVVFPGWNKNVWVQLKLLCATTNIEMYFQENKIIVAPVGLKNFILKNAQAESFGADIPDSTKSFIFTLGETSYVEDAIIKAFKQDENAGSVDHNETEEKIIKVPVSVTPNSLNQPEYTVDFPELYPVIVEEGSVGTVPGEYPNGFYCFCDKSGFRVPEQTVINSGAGVKVETTDNPFEIKVIITGPNEESDTPWTLAFATKDERTSALMITGSGVLVKRSEHTFGTGSDDGDEDKNFPYNPFLINKEYLYGSALRSAQKLAGPNVTIGLQTHEVDEADGQEFGFLPGAIMTWNKSRYRINSASYAYGSVSIGAEQFVSFENFNEIWDTLLFSDFTETMIDAETNAEEAMSFSDFGVLPLMEPVE